MLGNFRGRKKTLKVLAVPTINLPINFNQWKKSKGDIQIFFKFLFHYYHLIL